MRQATLLCCTVVLTLVAFGAVACDGDNGDEDATPAPTATARATSTPVPPPDIREADLAQQKEVKELTQRLGGDIRSDGIIYADVTGDSCDEAVIPIATGGAATNLAVIVVGYQDGELVSLLSAVADSGSIRPQVRAGQLVVSIPGYLQSDLPGFPSKIKNVYYRWDGAALIVEREETIDNPDQPPKQ